MSAALRTVFAELGFELDEATLERAEKLLRKVIATETEEGKNAKKVAGEVSKASKDKEKAIEGVGDVLKRVEDGAAQEFGDSILKRFPQLEALTKRYGVTAQGMGRIVAGASASIIAALSGATYAAFAFAQAFSADAEALRDTARESRVTTTELQELDHAAAQSGVGVERMRSGVQTFGQALRDGERWGNGTTSMLRRLGITTRDASGHIRPTGELLDETALAMERIESPTRRARVAVHLFGESGRRMLDVLHSGPGGIAALRAELAELGGGITPEAAEAAREFTQATERQARATDSLRSVLAITLLPALTWVMNAFARAEGFLARVTRGTHVAEIALVALGVAGAAAAAAVIVAWAPVLAPILAVVGGIAALVLLVDDLITLVEGGDSAVGRLIDGLFGMGTASQYVHELREEWESLMGVLERVIGALDWILTNMNPVALVGDLAPLFGGAARRAPEVEGLGRLTGPTYGTQVVNGRVAVSAPGIASAGGKGGTTKNTTHNHGPIHVHGVTDPAEVARRVDRIQQDRARLDRDGQHPGDDDS